MATEHAVPASEAPKQNNDPDEDPVARKIRWRDSAEYGRFKTVRNIIIVVVTILIILSLTVTYFQIQADTQFYMRSNSQFEVIKILFVTAAAIFMTGVVILGVEQTRRKDFEDRIRLGIIDKIGEKEKDLAKKAVDGKLDLPSLWALNQDRIEYYHRVAFAQAENSYKTAQAAGLAGFIAVLGLGALAAFAGGGTASIAAAAVGVAGAAMSAYIGATFVKTQQASSEQFRQFFQQPVEVARVLAAERLIATLEPEHRAESVKQVVLTMMVPPTSTSSDGKASKP
ncbi:hypothetical protein LR392_04700 [Arthrobacter sp. AK04]|uniref:hypothetical protein n=1 Tax=Arthrobacter sp. AK04 TaxID=2900048 RepID=UPI001E555CC4|nr:hypothetical protein [Arthrobacter sp. AK04]MCD5341528.1 hypothetical protein [Arthrobacter sp. AK04]